MKRANDLSILRGLLSIAATLLLEYMLPVCSAQQSRESATQSEIEYFNRPVVEDWTHHHVVFSNPGIFEDVQRNGREKDWRRIVGDPRYRMQWVKRYGASLRRPAHDSLGFANPPIIGRRVPVPGQLSGGNIHGDWGITLSGANQGVAIDNYPAKYTFAPIGTPDCTNDFVVFPINAPGSSSQADLMGMNNLYSGTCPTTPNPVPNVLFSYDVGTGDVQSSPVLSEDGTKIAFVEDKASASIFHVLTLDKSGNSGCPNAKPCNGRSSNNPVAPGGTLNSAVDTKITMSGGVTDTRSAPFVDYQRDIAYVADDTGKLHKFTGVFLGSPAEVTTSPWPFTVASGVMLTSPVFDGGTSQHIFVGGSDGNLYCVTFAGAACSTASISVAAGTTPGPVVDTPIVDSTNETVFAAASNLTNSILMQATTSLASPVRAAMGTAGTDLYNGAFDDAYFTSVGTGHMYFCGNLSNAGTPVLYRVTFNSSGTMSNANDGNSFQLVNSGNKGAKEDCIPLTEVFNTSENMDFLFVGVTDNGFSPGGTPNCPTTCTPNCANDTCIMTFSLPTTSPFTFPTLPVATGTNATLNLGNHGNSGIIIDNVSGAAGASQIYFGNLQQSTGVQASQSALQ